MRSQGKPFVQARPYNLQLKNRAAAIEVAKDGIRINSVVPGIIDTDIWNWDTGGRHHACGFFFLDP